MSSPRSQVISSLPDHPPRRIAVVASAEIWASKKVQSELGLDDVPPHFDVEVILAESATDIITAARRASSEADIVAAVGGDGTVSRVATGIFGSAAKLAIVPFGSTNIIAKSLGIPTQPRQ